ncbi:MAG: alkylhydroperoxidase AhpD family core domain-containing protein, partial [Myxococcota bacterium]
MRLEILENGHSRPQKLVFWLIRQLFGSVPGPILTMSYRRDLFGKHMAAILQEAMRGSSEWSKGET